MCNQQTTNIEYELYTQLTYLLYPNIGTRIIGDTDSVYYNFAIDSALSCYQRKLAQIIFVIFKLLI